MNTVEFELSDYVMHLIESIVEVHGGITVDDFFVMAAQRVALETISSMPQEDRDHFRRCMVARGEKDPVLAGINHYIRQQKAERMIG